MCYERFAAGKRADTSFVPTGWLELVTRRVVFFFYVWKGGKVSICIGKMPSFREIPGETKYETTAQKGTVL